MRTRYITAGVISAIAAMGAIGIGPASADVAIFCQQSSVTAGSGSLLGCAQGQVNTGNENILFSDPAAVTGPASTVTGVSNLSKTLFDFSSTSDTLKVNNGAGGAATIASTGDDVVNNLTYNLSPTQTYGSLATGFTVLDTNLDVQHASGSVTFTINGTGPGGAESFTSTAINLTQGGNKFEFRASNGEIIDSITYNTSDVADITVETVKQTQLTFSTGTPGCTPGTPGCVVNPPVLPEPGSLALLASGLFGMAALIRRRRNRHA